MKFWYGLLKILNFHPDFFIFMQILGIFPLFASFFLPRFLTSFSGQNGANMSSFLALLG